MFDNASGYPGLEAELAHHLVREFQADGILRPASRGADAVLRGTVRRVRRSVLQEDPHDDVVTGRVVVEAVISLEDVSSGKKILDRTRVTSQDAYTGDGVFMLRLGQTPDEARRSAVAELARIIVRRVVEVW